MRGLTVTLWTETQTGTDPLGNPICEEVGENVENVLVGEPNADDITASTALYGKQIRYMLGIPKTDTHDWMDKKVSWVDAYGHEHVCKTFGFPITGVGDLIPGPWHMKVRCAEYDG